MSFGLLNYRWVFSAGRFLQSAVASGTSNPQLGGPVIRTFQLPPPGVPHVWNDASEPQQRKVERWARNCREFCRKWRLPPHFWVRWHAVNLRHGTDGFTFPPKEGVLRIFSPKKSDGYGRVWTRELGYQRPARLPLDHRSHSAIIRPNKKTQYCYVHSMSAHIMRMYQYRVLYLVWWCLNESKHVAEFLILITNICRVCWQNKLLHYCKTQRDGSYQRKTHS